MHCFACSRACDTQLHGKTLGLIGGNGAIGVRVAEIASVFGMRVLVSSRSSGVSLEQLLRQSDFVSVHCPLSPQTKHLLDATHLAMMKPTAYLINTARGAIIDEPALVAALQAGVLAGAALDVQTTEPPPRDSPLYVLDKVILTPHIGWKKVETRQRLMGLVAANVTAFLDGKPINVVGRVGAKVPTSGQPVDAPAGASRTTKALIVVGALAAAAVLARGVKAQLLAGR